MRRRAGSALAVLALLAALSAPAAARAAVSTVADYRARVGQAVAAARAAEGRIDGRPAALALADELRSLLPETERVRVATATIDVSDPAMGGLLGELETAGTSTQRAATLKDIERHLATLQATTGAPSGDVPSDPAVLASLLADVRTGPGATDSSWFRDQIDRLLEVVARWLAGLSSTPEGAARVRTAWYAIAIVFACLALYVTWRGVRAWRRAVSRAERGAAGPSLSPVVAAAEGLPSDPAEYAETLARQGRYRDAVRALFGGAARALGERGVLARTRTRTNAELLSEVRASAPAVEPPLHGLSDVFEAAWYGHRDPDEPGFAEARAFYDAVVTPASERPPEGGEAR